MARSKAGGGEGGLKLSFDPGLAQPKKRSLTIAGHRTSITLEDAFWRELKAAAAELDVSVTALASAIDAAREPASLSAAIRVFLLTRRARVPSER
jgi:predicted DNA-binding ribbon-helix-helix protein